jgi:DNA polymerase III subunit epsilon
MESIATDAPWHDIPIALIDVETTGREASQDRVIELGIAVGLRGEVIARHNWLINPGMPISEEARAIHGISNDDVRDAPAFSKIAAEISKAMAGAIPAAYNAPFDKAFVLSEFARAGAPLGANLARSVEWFDPLIWARELLSDQKSRALGEVCNRLGIKLENAHRASDDAEAALHVLYNFARDTRVPRSYGAFLQEQRRLGLLQSDERRHWR